MRNVWLHTPDCQVSHDYERTKQEQQHLEGFVSSSGDDSGAVGGEGQGGNLCGGLMRVAQQAAPARHITPVLLGNHLGLGRHDYPCGRCRAELACMCRRY